MGNQKSKNAELPDPDTTATDNEKIEWLSCIIDDELAKPEAQRDVDLIRECCDYIKELMPPEERHTEEDLRAKCKELTDRIQESCSGKTLSHNVKPRRISFKAAAVIAAVLLVVGGTLAIAATSDGFSKAFEYVSVRISELLNMDPEDVKKENGITIIRNDKGTTYDSMESLLAGEGLDIMYPSVLPDGVTIRKVRLLQDADGTRYSVNLQTSSDDISITIYNYLKTDMTAVEHKEYVSARGISFNWFGQDNGVYQAVCHDRGYEYVIVTHNYSQMITIIENLKEMEK